MRKKLQRLHPKRLYRNQILRLATLSATSAGVAYLTASLVPWIDAYIAAVFALAAIKPTLHASMKESFQQIIGTVLGAVFGIILVALLGFNIFTLIIMVAVAFLIAWRLRLGETGAVMMGVTIILITGPINELQEIEARLAGVILGSLFAIVASYFMLPGKPNERVIEASMRLSKQATTLLNTIAYRMREREHKISINETEHWNETVEIIMNEVLTVKTEAEETVKGVKWSPLLKREEAAQALEHINNTENIVLIIRNIVNDINITISGGNRLPDTVAINISEVLLTTSEKLEEATNSEVNLDTSELSKIENKKLKALDSIRNVDNTQAITLGGSLIQDASKLEETLKQD